MTQNKPTITFDATETVERTAKKFADIDKTSPRIVKILRMPYLPMELNEANCTWNDGEQLPQVDLNNRLNFVNTTLLYPDRAPDENSTPISFALDKFVTVVNPSALDLRNDIYESKLYHSDFYHQTFIYDSFSYDFKLEELIINNNEDAQLGVDFVTSAAATGKCLFKFNLNFDNTQSHYPGLLVINRNLEVPVWNNYYMQYLRNGYNYDVKNKETSQIASGIGTGIGVASTIAGIALAASGYGSGLGAGLIVSGVASVAGSVTSSITSAQNADRALQHKLDQAKNQAATVEGSDDLGLLSYYAEDNKAKLVTYDLSAQSKAAIADLFYYCGYACNEQEKPKLNTRTWFNFIQCNPVFDSNIFMSAEVREDLISKYNAGVTVMHNVSGT